MIKNNIQLKELAFVGYPVTDFEEARRFYGEILGLTETITFGPEDQIDWLEYDLAGQTLALAKASDQWQPNPNGGGACLEVQDLDTAIASSQNHSEHAKAPQTASGELRRRPTPPPVGIPPASRRLAGE